MATNITMQINHLGTMRDVKDKNGKVTGQEPCKGNISFYGMGRFPITMYPNQLLALLEKADVIKAEVNKAVKAGTLTLSPPKAGTETPSGRIRL